MARPGLDKHPKFRLLVRLLGEPRPHVRGYLELLWECAYENGDPVIGDSEAVEAAAEFPGEAGKLTDALLKCGGNGRCGLIEPAVDGLFQVHDLYDHAPDYVQRRMRREHQRREKGVTLSELRAQAGRKGGASKRKQTADSCLQSEANGATPAPAPAPAPALNTDSSEPDVPAAEQKPDDPVLMEFECTGQVKTWQLTASLAAKFKVAYPGVDRKAEYLKAQAWLAANPTRRKTARGMPRFLNAWLDRAQNRGSRWSVGPVEPVDQPYKEH